MTHYSLKPQSDYDLCTSWSAQTAINVNGDDWTGSSQFLDSRSGVDSTLPENGPSLLEQSLLAIVQESDERAELLRDILSKLDSFEVKIDSLLYDSKYQPATGKGKLDLRKSLQELVNDERLKRSQQIEGTAGRTTPVSSADSFDLSPDLDDADTETCGDNQDTDSGSAIDDEAETESDLFDDEEEDTSSTEGSTSSSVDAGTGEWSGAGHKEKIFKAFLAQIHEAVDKDPIAGLLLTDADKECKDEYDFIAVRNLCRGEYTSLTSYEQALYRAFYYLPAWQHDLIADIFEGETWPWELAPLESTADEGAPRSDHVTEDLWSHSDANQDVYADMPSLVPYKEDLVPADRFPVPGSSSTADVVAASQRRVWQSKGWIFPGECNATARVEFDAVTKPNNFACDCASRGHRFVSNKDHANIEEVEIETTRRDLWARLNERLCSTTRHQADHVIKSTIPSKRCDDLETVMRRKMAQRAAQAARRSQEQKLSGADLAGSESELEKID